MDESSQQEQKEPGPQITDAPVLTVTGDGAERTHHPIVEMTLVEPEAKGGLLIDSPDFDKRLTALDCAGALQLIYEEDYGQAKLEAAEHARDGHLVSANKETLMSVRELPGNGSTPRHACVDFRDFSDTSLQRMQVFIDRLRALNARIEQTHHEGIHAAYDEAPTRYHGTREEQHLHAYGFFYDLRELGKAINDLAREKGGDALLARIREQQATLHAAQIQQEIDNGERFGRRSDEGISRA